MKNKWDIITQLRFSYVGSVVAAWNDFIESKNRVEYIQDMYDSINLEDGILYNMTVKDMYDHIYLNEDGEPEFDLGDQWIWRDENDELHSCTAFVFDNIPVIDEDLYKFLDYIVNDERWRDIFGLDS